MALQFRSMDALEQLVQEAQPCKNYGHKAAGVYKVQTPSGSQYVQWRISEMTTDEMALALLAAGWVTVDPETGNVFIHRGPGGPRLSEPSQAKGTIINGYRSSKFHLNGETHPIRHHRLIWISANGSPPEGFVICHRNNNKLDNRLSNLYLATPQQNSHDAKRDGLYPDYNHHPRAKIGIETAQQIANDYKHGQGSIYQLAKKYGISKSRVSQIVHEFG
ncbi:HNH endonuclease signature motif containing protein [Sulfobacillus thermosulfidooxidans]|uniref:HNH endonuclease signature motif containing protein n=1 Tax=Sulfobacillus thermosulfidooxidans TaxID=28034 RepID=UPI0006B47FBF|nr:HNH endonuclease signature motif containing protein [Sulfobacillus thermosulfidooxidans]